MRTKPFFSDVVLGGLPYVISSSLYISSLFLIVELLDSTIEHFDILN